MHHTDEKKPTVGSNPTAGSTDPNIVPDTTDTRKLASAARILKMALLCAVVVAPVACIELVGAPAVNCVRCLDV